MRIFVTGATGFIGSHFVVHALAAGHEVVALRRAESSAPRISLKLQPRWLTRSLLDVVDQDLLGIDCLVHLAAVGVSPRTAPWDELLLWNVTAPMRLLGEAAKVGVTRWVVTGSFAEYGASADRYDFIPADAPLEPTFPYAASKAAGAVLFQALARELPASLRYLRLFSVYGEGQHEGNLWPAIRHAALAGEDFSLTPGEQLRDFIAVEEVARALLAACTDAVTNPSVKAYNVASGQPQAVREFASHWWRHWNAAGVLRIGALPYRAGEVMRYVPRV